jgi:Fur family ferric uptake transcriptional regulator
LVDHFLGYDVALVYIQPVYEGYTGTSGERQNKQKACYGDAEGHGMMATRPNYQVPIIPDHPKSRQRQGTFPEKSSYWKNQVTWGIFLENQDIRKAGLKVTVPRVKILEMLETRIGSERHLTAEDVYKTLIHEGEEIGLATVYRVLTQFEAAGLVKRHHFEGGNSIFELNRGDHHDHMVCVKCGRVEEFSDELIEARQREIAISKRFELTDHALCLYGVCADCRGAPKTA